MTSRCVKFFFTVAYWTAMVHYTTVQQQSTTSWRVELQHIRVATKLKTKRRGLSILNRQHVGCQVPANCRSTINQLLHSGRLILPIAKVLHFLAWHKRRRVWLSGFILVLLLGFTRTGFARKTRGVFCERHFICCVFDAPNKLPTSTCFLFSLQQGLDASQLIKKARLACARVLDRYFFQVTKRPRLLSYCCSFVSRREELCSRYDNDSKWIDRASYYVFKMVD